jgi:carbon-monoxide dehydrogenase iron sulfur subunit
MGKIVIDSSKCTGCRYCEVASNFFRGGICNYNSLCIEIFRNDRESQYFPKVCKQCIDPPCAKGCPQEAIFFHKETDTVIIDEGKCNGCGLCKEMCPDAIPKIDESKGVAVKCNLCGGDPYCVRFCATRALIYKV